MRTSLITMAAALVVAGAAFAQSNQISVAWDELGPRVDGKKVALVLPDGTELHGTVRDVAADGLSLDIEKTSNKKVQPKGLWLIPKSSLSVLRLTGYRKSGRTFATVGALAAGITLTAVATNSAGEGSPKIIVPAMGGLATGVATFSGYYFGKAIDKHETVIRIVP